MAKEIDRRTGQGALAVIKQHPGMVLFVASPGNRRRSASVWWLVGAGWAAVLLIVGVVGGGAVRADEARLDTAMRIGCSPVEKAAPAAL